MKLKEKTMAHVVDGNTSNPTGFASLLKRKEALLEKSSKINHSPAASQDLNGDGVISKEEKSIFAKILQETKAKINISKKELEAMQEALDTPIKASKPSFSAES